MAEIVVWQDGRPKCRYIGCVPTPEEQRSLRRGGCEIRVDGKPVCGSFGRRKTDDPIYLR